MTHIRSSVGIPFLSLSRRRLVLTPRYVHGPGQLRLFPVDDEVVALGLAADGFDDGLAQGLGPFRMAHDGFQVGAVFLAQAHVKHAGASHPQAIAAFTKAMGQGRDEA